MAGIPALVEPCPTMGIVLKLMAELAGWMTTCGVLTLRNKQELHKFGAAGCPCESIHWPGVRHAASSFKQSVSWGEESTAAKAGYTQGPTSQKTATSSCVPSLMSTVRIVETR